MDLDTLRAQTAAHLAFLYPSLAEASDRLADECLASALRCFRGDFVCLLGPQAWARITIIYFKHFVDTGIDVTVGEMFAAVMRDAVDNSRMDLLTLQLAQERQAQLAHLPGRRPPHLHVVRT